MGGTAQPSATIGDRFPAEGLAIDPNLTWITTNLTHGYLFDHQYEKAKILYLENKDIKVNDKQTFAEAVLDDFRKFRQKGLTHPDMEKIEQLLRPSARSTAREAGPLVCVGETITG